MNKALQLLAEQPRGQLVPQDVPVELMPEMARAVNVGGARRVTIAAFRYYYEITDKGRNMLLPLPDDGAPNPYAGYTVAQLGTMRKYFQRQLNLIEELVNG